MGDSINWEQFSGDGGKFPEIKWKPIAAGDQIAGEVTNVRIADFGAEKSPELWVRTDSGEEVSVLASQTNLKRLLAQHRPNIGDRIAIVYKGDGQSSKAGFSPPKLFDVAVKPAGGEPGAAPAAPVDASDSGAVTAANII
jgi:hypothetical protein